MTPEWIVTIPGGEQGEGYQGRVRELSRDGDDVNVEALEDILDIVGKVEVARGETLVVHASRLSPI